MRSIFALLVLSAACSNGSQGGPFLFPVEGTLNEDLFYTYYVDHGEGSAISDFHCGPKSYDGHLGTDIALRSFEHMDLGVDVYAANDGRVDSVHDGEFDRNKAWGVGGFGNHVVLSHADGRTTVYGHLAKGSITVSVGEDVARGQTIGRVGSSGNSDFPHLHFEVRESQAAVDPSFGPCNSLAVSLWSTWQPYDTARKIIDSGISDQEMSLEFVKERPPKVQLVSTAEQTVTMWVHFANVQVGSVSTFDLIAPDGTVHWSTSYTHDEFLSMAWWWASHPVAGTLDDIGTWSFRFSNGGEELAKRDFNLVPAAGRKSAVSPRRDPSAGGGALHRPH